VVKVVDGRAFNNFFWVFYGALSNVEYTLTVTDTATGAVRSYSNPQGTLASVSDTSAFPGGPASMATGGAGSSEFPLTPALSRPEREKSAACAADPTTLCLNGGRFQVRVSWRAPGYPAANAGQAVPLTSDTGALWFFSNGNLELVVKVVDGRAVNGKFWV